MTLPDVPPEALDLMRDLYRSLDRDIAALAPSCSCCGKCCDFHTSGLVLYMGPLEAALFFSSSVAPSPLMGEGRVRVPPLLPPVSSSSSVSSSCTCSLQPAACSLLCPFLIDSLCTNRAERSIGCRTHFCDPSLRDRLQALHETYLHLSANLCLRLHLPWQYQSLTRWMDLVSPSNRAR